MTSRFTTDPTDEDRAYARDMLDRNWTDPATRAAAVGDMLAWRLAAVRETCDEDLARTIARGRALYEALAEAEGR